MRPSFFAMTCLALYTMPLKAGSSVPTVPNLLFEEAIETAVRNDPWLEGSVHKQQSLDSLSVAAAQLPDPKISVGLANLATDTFDFDQERMTQLKFGVSQAFPRGQTRKLKKAQLDIQSKQFPYLRSDRIGQITMQVGNNWLDLYEAQASLRIVNNSRQLFENLVDVAASNYSAAITKANQLDIVQAELELSLLDDRIAVLEQSHQTYLAQLSRWLGRSLGTNTLLEDRLPEIALSNKDPVFERFMLHPAVLSVDKKIAADEVNIHLAEQQYKPAWSVNLGYGYRENDPAGFDRADLLSVGINFDLPIFTNKRQDQKLAAAVQSHNALLTEKEAVIRQLMVVDAENYEAISGLRKRAKLYQQELLPQIKESIEIALRAYSADEGTFNDVIRAQINELEAALKLLQIQVEIQKRILAVNYARMRETNDLIAVGGDS